MLVNKLKQSKSSGFTIIEVMIVLGIAAAIMLIVLIAIPQLQRNQRNTARKDVLGRISTEIQNYAGNNNGSIPATAAEFTTFQTRYLSNINTNDPKTGTAHTYTLTADPTATTGTTPGIISYRPGRICNGENSTTTNASQRNFSLQIALEGGAFFCLDNQ